jgi:hypothetical protein
VAEVWPTFREYNFRLMAPKEASANLGALAGRAAWRFDSRFCWLTSLMAMYD